MYDITVFFENCRPLDIKLHDNEVAQNWKKLFQKNLAQSLPLTKNHQQYSFTYLQTLIHQANQKLTWNFDCEIVGIPDTVKLHKHIETVCAEGFASIPAEHDNLIHEIHACIHALEASHNLAGDTVPPHDGILTLEWYNDDGFALDINFEHKFSLEVGDIKLQNPYVGHSPLQVYRTNDYSNINQTCRFHDLVRPGLTIVTQAHNRNDFSLSHYIKWWRAHAPSFVAQHSIETILHYTGHPVIGRVVNYEDISQISTARLLDIVVN